MEPYPGRKDEHFPNYEPVPIEHSWPWPGFAGCPGAVGDCGPYSDEFYQYIERALAQSWNTTSETEIPAPVPPDPGFNVGVFPYFGEGLWCEIDWNYVTVHSGAAWIAGCLYRLDGDYPLTGPNTLPGVDPTNADYRLKVPPYGHVYNSSVFITKSSAAEFAFAWVKHAELDAPAPEPNYDLEHGVVDCLLANVQIYRPTPSTYSFTITDKRQFLESPYSLIENFFTFVQPIVNNVPTHQNYTPWKYVALNDVYTPIKPKFCSFSCGRFAATYPAGQLAYDVTSLITVPFSAESLIFGTLYYDDAENAQLLCYTQFPVHPPTDNAHLWVCASVAPLNPVPIEVMYMIATVSLGSDPNARPV
jgi:hypothetical protein